jgi:hypothetical protein
VEELWISVGLARDDWYTRDVNVARHLFNHVDVQDVYIVTLPSLSIYPKCYQSTIHRQEYIKAGD